MKKNFYFIALSAWIFSMLIWHFIFNFNSVLTPVIWEIHTIFSSVLLFFFVINYCLSQALLDIVKIVFRLLFKVWFVIFIAFSMKKTFDLKGFLLTATFVFGYLEALIDLNAWIINGSLNLILVKYDLENTKHNRMLICTIILSIIHVFSALIAFLFFDVL